KRRISGMALLILALLQRIFLMSSLMLLLVWLIFFMVLIKLLPILGTISPVEFIAAVIAYYVHPVNIQTACLIMEGAEFTENIINGVERPVKAAELFAFTLRVRAGNTDVLTDAEENVRQKLRAEGVM